MKIPHLRNLYQKVSMFGYAVPSVESDTPVQTLEATPTPHMGDQVRGFGYEHDASTPTLFNFLRVPTGQFIFADEPGRSGAQKVAELTAYLLNLRYRACTGGGAASDTDLGEPEPSVIPIRDITGSS